MAVRQARAKGISWERIGAILDLSPTEVARRYGRPWRRLTSAARIQEPLVGREPAQPAHERVG
jgi:hypothetical protein